MTAPMRVCPGCGTYLSEGTTDCPLCAIIAKAIATERERCAKIAEAHAEEMLGIETGGLYCGCGEDIAAKIRSGE